MTAWISRLDPYPLPEGIGNRWKVKILAVGPKFCAVETEDMAQWVVPRIHLDCGRRYDVAGNGSFAPEDHPAVQQHLMADLERLRGEVWDPQVDKSRLEHISRNLWILRRHGYRVEPAADQKQQHSEALYDQEVIRPGSEEGFMPFRPILPRDEDDSPP